MVYTSGLKEVFCICTSRPSNIPYSYMDPLGTIKWTKEHGQLHVNCGYTGALYIYIYICMGDSINRGTPI